MSIRYKFKNTTQYDTINFVGNSISVGDFKREVIKQKHLTTNDDLKVVVADTKKEFIKPDDQLPKNVSIIVSRVPRTPKSEKSNVTKGVLTCKTNCINVERNTKTQDEIAKTVLDLSKLKISEEKKIELKIKQSTSEYRPVYTPHVNGKLSAVPSELVCPICAEIFVDAVMIPCCGAAFCDYCIRKRFLVLGCNKCPECFETDIDLQSLIASRYIRKAVNAFKSKGISNEASCKNKK